MPHYWPTWTFPAFFLHCMTWIRLINDHTGKEQAFLQATMRTEKSLQEGRQENRVSRHTG